MTSFHEFDMGITNVVVSVFNIPGRKGGSSISGRSLHLGESYLGNHKHQISRSACCCTGALLHKGSCRIASPGIKQI